MTATPPTLSLLQQKRQAIYEIAARYGIRQIEVFGSVARGDATPQSDVDLLVRFPERFSLLDLSELVQSLQHLLGYRVEISSRDHIREELRSSIERDIVLL